MLPLCSLVDDATANVRWIEMRSLVLFWPPQYRVTHHVVPRFFEIKTKVAFHNMLLIIKHIFCFDVNKHREHHDGLPCLYVV